MLGSSDYEKSYAINYYLNKYFFEKLDKCYEKRNSEFPVGKDHLYKYRMIFSGEREDHCASYSTSHSMLARVVLDFPKCDIENEIITNLRENINKILEFAKDDSKDTILVKNCDREYQRFYKDMLRHLLYSMQDLPSNINVNSIKKIGQDLTYVIEKNKLK